MNLLRLAKNTTTITRNLYKRTGSGFRTDKHGPRQTDVFSNGPDGFSNRNQGELFSNFTEDLEYKNKALDEHVKGGVGDRLLAEKARRNRYKKIAVIYTGILQKFSRSFIP